VTDAQGQALAYVYYEDEVTRRDAVKFLSGDETLRNAVISRSCRTS
jgi:hypothetical protein